MRAVVHTRYGPAEDVLQVQDIDQPSVGDDEVFVRVHATSVHADVWHVVNGFPWVLRLMGNGVFSPHHRVPGTDLSGTVEAVGKDVTRFEVGDAVFGESHGEMQWKNGGAFAEYASVPEAALALKPDNVTFEEAASVATAGYIVLINLRGPAEIQPGWKVLVNGAGGGVGSIAVQVAKARGAQVTAVDAAEKLDMLRQLGADRVVDYRQQDVTRLDERYHLVFDVASTLSVSRCKPILTDDGVYVIIGHDHYGGVGRRVFGSLPTMFLLMARSPFNRHLPAVDFSTPPKDAVMAQLAELLESGALTPVIDRTFPLEEAGEAIRYLQAGTAIGKILLTP